MSALKTFRFWLEPDEQFPMFQRLKWELVNVSIRDVLTNGIHPWTTNNQGTDVHPSLIEAFLLRLNDPAVKVAELESFGYGYDMSAHQGYYYEKQTRFERTLEYVQKDVYFVDKLTYLQLLDIAKQNLRERWDGRLARLLAESVNSGFQELRQFLKAKDRSIKLSGRDDLNSYDLGKVLSLDDFEGKDTVLLSTAFPTLNFRRASVLEQVTDRQGRLRLSPEIRKVTLTMLPQSTDYIHLVWHVERNGDVCRFRPEIGKNDAKRRKAKEFAKKWRTDEGRLCFSTGLEQLVRMVEEEAVVVSFPALGYTFKQRVLTATAELPTSRVQAFHIGAFYNEKNRGEDLKDVLREYDVSMTGNKNQLLKKLAKLAAKKYQERKPEMDAFFTEHRFIRIKGLPTKTEHMPLFEDGPLLRNLLLTMYAMKHLRGTAILEPSHENNTYTEEQLAAALVTGKVNFMGSFLRVA